MGRSRTEKIRAFLLRAIADGLGSPSKLASEHFGLTRQATSRHLANLIQAGFVGACGQTRARKYSLVPSATQSHTVRIGASLEEDRVWANYFADPLSVLPGNVLEICYVGFTEMLNNAKDHSEGTTAWITLTLNAVNVEMSVSDDGTGVFRKIKQGLGLNDEREAILELSKGKVTTDPAAHTGEGIFFTSRMFDEFCILSHGLFFSHADKCGDWLIEAKRQNGSGTFVWMKIDRESGRNSRDIYDQFASDVNANGVPSFSKTRVLVRLLRTGQESLVSRSQAKRLLAGFQRFKEVMLDFEGIDSIGQAFADEIFRVFQNTHPEIRIEPVNVKKGVEQMIWRAGAEARSGGHNP